MPSPKRCAAALAVLALGLIQAACVSAPLRYDTAAAAELLAADNAFAEKSKQSGPAEAFATYMAEDGVQVPPTGEMPRGPEAIRRSWAESAPIALLWTPQAAQVSASGDLGWTWGDWEAFQPDAQGKRVAYGRYVNVWRRDDKGQWKVVVDIGNTVRTALE